MLLFQLDLDDTYDPAERAGNGENKQQAQLREVWELLRTKFELQDLKQSWVAKAVRHFFPFFESLGCWTDHECSPYPVYERYQHPTIQHRHPYSTTLHIHLWR